ncbi:MAG TPA: serine hydrolase [Thermoanaerobaculia bacterium]|jgi:CubicO group peptidase (beta-lactamase class C family)
MRAWCGVVLLLALGYPIAAQEPAARHAAVDAVFARHVSADGPGCAVAVVRRAQLVYARGYGLADVEHGTPFTPQTVFGIGSIYKQLVAAAILLLERQGKLSLEDDIRKFVPEIPDYGARITVRQLLDHTHGLRESSNLAALTPVRSERPADVLRLLSRQRGPAAAPGARVVYGNTGPLLARLIVTRVSGQPLGDFMRQQVFGPLGMRSTYVGDDSRAVPLRAMGYRRGPDGALIAVPSGGRNESTVEDLARWGRNLERPARGWKRLLRRMRTPQALRNGEVPDYGLGLRLSPYRGLERVWHPGLASGGVAILMHFPEPRLTIAIGCNNQTLEPILLAESVADVLLRDELARAEPQSMVTLPDEALARLAGTYVSDTGSVLRIASRNGRLYAKSEGGSRRLEGESETGEHELVPVSPTRFVFPGRPKLPLDPASEAVFEIPRDGGRTMVEVRTDWFPLRFTAVEPAGPSATVPRAALGAYRNVETESTVTILEREGRMELKTPHEQLEIVPVSRNLFRAGRFLLRFSPATGEQVLALDLTVGAVPNLRFDRQ